MKETFHKKLKHPQSDLLTNKLKKVSLLFNLRIHCVKAIKENVHGLYKLTHKCNICNNGSDTQKHLLKNIVLKQWNHDII